MAVTMITGQATSIALGSDYSYAATANHGPVAIKNQLVSMRLNNKPVLFRTRTLPSISEGDYVAAAGKQKAGTLEAMAVRNLTTGALYAPPTIVAMIMCIVLILIGIPLIPMLGIGLVFSGLGVWILLRAIAVRRAVAMLKAAPAAAPA